VPADASSLIPLVLDQLRENPQVDPGEVLGLLERLAEVPYPRDPRGLRHRLAVVLALAACADARKSLLPLTRPRRQRAPDHPLTGGVSTWRSGCDVRFWWTIHGRPSVDGVQVGPRPATLPESQAASGAVCHLI
jgi:hypothetical protein